MSLHRNVFFKISYILVVQNLSLKLQTEIEKCLKNHLNKYVIAGDKTLVQSLVRDAMVIKELDAHTGHASHHSQ